MTDQEKRAAVLALTFLSASASEGDQLASAPTHHIIVNSPRVLEEGRFSGLNYSSDGSNFYYFRDERRPIAAGDVISGFHSVDAVDRFPLSKYRPSGGASWLVLE